MIRQHIMPWNPKKYNEFQNIRHQPFYDVAALIQDQKIDNAVDLGCGTGEQTCILAKRFSETQFIGIDASAEMLAATEERSNDHLSFKLSTVEEFTEQDQHWDLIFSNAALQWSNSHEILFPKLLSLLKENGQFAVQMPVQEKNILNQILLKLAQEEPYQTQLNGWNIKSPVLAMDEYAQILFDAGMKNIQVIKKIYPIIADGVEILYDFIAGSALIPYLDRLEEIQQKTFISAYKERIASHFFQFPAIYTFKRILMYGLKKTS